MTDPVSDATPEPPPRSASDGAGSGLPRFTIPRWAYAVAAVVTVVVIVALYVQCGNSVPPTTAERDLQQQAEQGAERADALAGAAKEKETYAVEQRDKASEHRARRRAIRQQADERLRDVEAAPDSDLPRLYADSVDRARAAIERARAGRRDPQPGAASGADSH